MPLRPYWGQAGAGLITIGLAGMIVVLAAISTSRTSRELLVTGVLVLLVVGVVLFALHVKNKRHAESTREFTDLSPAELMETAKAGTAIQSAKILEPHYSKWLRASGPLSNVTPWDADCGALVTLSNYQLANHMSFFFEDKRTVEGRLAALPAGAQLTIIGKIATIGVMDITLNECQLESVITTPSSPE